MNDALKLWPKAKGILLPYEGSASQIYVFDLPFETLGTVIDRFDEVTEDSLVSCLNGFAYENPLKLTNEVRQTLTSQPDEPVWHILLGKWIQDSQLQLHLWISEPFDTFEVELVFWGDQLFPNAKDDIACFDKFSALVSFIESLRSLHPESECALTASEASDPRVDRNQIWTLFW